MTAIEDPEYYWTDNELRALAAQITYKPTYRIELRRAPYEFAAILFQIQVVTWDATSPNNMYHLQFEQIIPCYMGLSKTQLLDLIRKAFHTFETHEADEWFRVDGQRVTNPHGPVTW